MLIDQLPPYILYVANLRFTTFTLTESVMCSGLQVRQRTNNDYKLTDISV